MCPKEISFQSSATRTMPTTAFRQTAAPVRAEPAPDSAGYGVIDAYFDRQMQRLKIPGAALAIVEGDRIVHMRGFGRARLGGDAPTAQTPFFIGSITKSFTALAVMQLVEDGRIELDAPVQRYLPWFRVADAEASARITVRHLLPDQAALHGLLSASGISSSTWSSRVLPLGLSARRTARPGSLCRREPARNRGSVSPGQRATARPTGRSTSTPRSRPPSPPTAVAATSRSTWSAWP